MTLVFDVYCAASIVDGQLEIAEAQCEDYCSEALDVSRLRQDIKMDTRALFSPTRLLSELFDSSRNVQQSQMVNKRFAEKTCAGVIERADGTPNEHHSSRHSDVTLTFFFLFPVRPTATNVFVDVFCMVWVVVALQLALYSGHPFLVPQKY